MNSYPKSAGLLTGANASPHSGHFDGIDRASTDVHQSHLRQPPGVHSAERVDRLLLAPARNPARILLVDAALVLYELHLEQLRSIPAMVDMLFSCADMYRHEGRAYELVILILQPESKETAGAAHFVRHRWSTAKILLLAHESAALDDWLYDERVDPGLHPAAVRKAAIQLLSEGKAWIST